MSTTTTDPNTKEEGKIMDEKVNLIEFIKSIDKIKLEAIEIERRIAEEEAQAAELNSNNKDSNTGKLASGFRFLSRKSKDPALNDLLSDGPNERKLSAEPQTRLKPSLRMKAFKNRQDTFHSLASCCDPPPETASSNTNVNSSSASLTEDLMRMPCVEGLNPQVTQIKQKVYNKVHSEPLLQNGNNKRSEEPKKRRVLHTVVQPDGAVVGFCTEESDESVVEEQVVEKPNSSGQVSDSKN